MSTARIIRKVFLKFYNNASQKIVPDSGHIIFVDQPEISNQMIDDLLSGRGI